MASCEKCWQEAGGNPDKYRELLKVNGCSPEEQAGGIEMEAKQCPKCTMNTIHMYVGRCINPSCDYLQSE